MYQMIRPALDVLPATEDLEASDGAGTGAEIDDVRRGVRAHPSRRVGLGGGGEDVTVLTAYEGVGGVLVGTVPEEEVNELELVCAPTIGTCPGQFTANTMGMVFEALGLAPLGSSMIPAVFAERQGIARRAGHAVMAALEKGGPLPRDLVTRTSLENAAAVVAATGGSTNAALHLPAIANEAGIAFDMDDVAFVFDRTPLVADLQPGGRFLARDIHGIGGAPVIFRLLMESGLFDGGALEKYARLVGQANTGAVTHSGGVEWEWEE